MPQQEQPQECEPPKDGEWWVCCYHEALEHFGGGVEAVPADCRLVALRQEFHSCKPMWCLSGEPDPSEDHWLMPIRKVDLGDVKP